MTDHKHNCKRSRRAYWTPSDVRTAIGDLLANVGDLQSELYPRRKHTTTVNSSSHARKPSSGASDIRNLPTICLFHIGRFLDPHTVLDLFDCCQTLHQIKTSSTTEFETMHLNVVLDYFSILECHAENLFGMCHATSNHNNNKKKQQRRRRRLRNKYWRLFFSHISRVLSDSYETHGYFVPKLHRALVAEQTILEGTTAECLLCFRGSKMGLEEGDDYSDNDDNEGLLIFEETDMVGRQASYPSWEFLTYDPDMNRDTAVTPQILCGDVKNSFRGDPERMEEMQRFLRIMEYKCPLFFLVTDDSCGGWPVFLSIDMKKNNEKQTTTHCSSGGSSIQPPQPWQLIQWNCGGEFTESISLPQQIFSSMAELFCLGHYREIACYHKPVLDFLLNHVAWLVVHQIPPFDQEAVIEQLHDIAEAACELAMGGGGYHEGDTDSLSRWTVQFLNHAIHVGMPKAQAKQYITLSSEEMNDE